MMMHTARNSFNIGMRICGELRNFKFIGSQHGRNRDLSTAEGLSPVEMAHVEYGERDTTTKPPILILHGVLGSKSNWNSLSKALNNHTKRKVIALDARNHGDSPHSDEFSYEIMANDVKYLMDQKKLDKACLIGHSMGGRTMMRAALNYPDRVEKLIVVDISPIQLSAKLVIEQYLDLFEKIIIDDNLPLSQGRRVADHLMQERVPDLDIRQFLLSNLTKVDGHFRWKANISSLKSNFQNIVRFPLDNEVFNNPVLFIGGTKSDYLKPEDQDKILKYFPNAQFEYLATGHWVHAEKPADFLKLASEFINSS